VSWPLRIQAFEGGSFAFYNTSNQQWPHTPRADDLHCALHALRSFCAATRAARASCSRRNSAACSFALRPGRTRRWCWRFSSVCVQGRGTGAKCLRRDSTLSDECSAATFLAVSGNTLFLTTGPEFPMTRFCARRSNGSGYQESLPVSRNRSTKSPGRAAASISTRRCWSCSRPAGAGANAALGRLLNPGEIPHLLELQIDGKRPSAELIRDGQM